jgi:hypothetical protein
MENQEKTKYAHIPCICNVAPARNIAARPVGEIAVLFAATALVTTPHESFCSWLSLTGGFAVPIPKMRGWFTPQPIHAEHPFLPPDA